MLSSHATKKICNSSFFVFILIVFISFLIYLSSICPTIYWRDSPEFVDVAYTLGISHPAGSPAYSTISKLFTFLPFSSISFKINLVSLFFALSAIVFIGKVIQILLYLHYPSIKKVEANLIIMLSSLFLTIMPSFWLKAIVAEVYTMNAFFLVLILYFFLKWSIENDFRYVLLAAFLYGLSSGVHAGVVLFLPGFLLFFLLVQLNQRHCTPKENKEFINKSFLKSFTLISLFFLLGFSIYLYLPVRSITNPEFDWGNPEILSNFYSHISDKKDASLHFRNIAYISSLLKDSSAFVKMIVEEITSIGLLLFILGMTIHLIKDRRGFVLLFLTSLINTLFYLASTFAVYKNGILFIPSFIIFIIWIANGIYFIRNTKTQLFPGVNLGKLSIPVILIFVFFHLLMNYQKVDKSNYYLTENIVKEMYIDINPNSILFSYPLWFSYRYMQDVKNLRPDLIIIHTRDMIRPDVFNPVTESRYPMLKFPEIAATKDTFYDFWPLFVKKNIEERKFYSDVDRFIIGLGFENIFPYKKFLMEIVDKKIEKDFDQLEKNYYQELQLSINNDISQDAFFLDQKEGVKTYYKIFLFNFANYLRLNGKFEKALSFLNLAESLVDEKTKEIPMMKAICLAELGRYEESILLFENLLTEYPNDKSILANLGNLYFTMKDYPMAKHYIMKAINLDEESPKAHFILGMIYSDVNRIEESIVEIKKGINMSNNPLEKNKMENYLKKVMQKESAKL